MNKLAASMCAVFSVGAWADKYGVDEALAESSGGLGEMVLGGLLVAGIYLLWKKFLG